MDRIGRSWTFLDGIVISRVRVLTTAVSRFGDRGVNNLGGLTCNFVLLCLSKNVSDSEIWLLCWCDHTYSDVLVIVSDDSRAIGRRREAMSMRDRRFCADPSSGCIRWTW